MPKIILKRCIECGKRFWGDSRPHHKRCSIKCRNKSKSWRKFRSLNAKKYIGKDNPNWKGGKIESRGYVMLYAPSHPFATKLGYVFEHRLKIEKKIGRFLKPKEVVHHKNGNKKDNSLKNLVLFSTHSEHITFHNTHRK
jgi:hypothetical protein